MHFPAIFYLQDRHLHSIIVEVMKLFLRNSIRIRGTFEQFIYESDLLLYTKVIRFCIRK